MALRGDRTPLTAVCVEERRDPCVYQQYGYVVGYQMANAVCNYRGAYGINTVTYGWSLSGCSPQRRRDGIFMVLVFLASLCLPILSAIFFFSRLLFLLCLNTRLFCGPQCLGFVPGLFLTLTLAGRLQQPNQQPNQPPPWFRSPQLRLDSLGLSLPPALISFCPPLR